METALALIQSDPTPCHHILTFLSDGQHQHSRPLMSTFPPMDDIKLTVINVGIGQPDIRFGMRLKQAVETVPIAHLENVYYAATEAVFLETCTNVVYALSQHTQAGVIHNVQLSPGFCFAHTRTRACTVFMEEAATHFLLVVRDDKIKEAEEKKDQVHFLVNGEPITSPDFFEWADADITALIDVLVAQFARIRMTINEKHSVIAIPTAKKSELEVFRERIQEVETFLNACESIQKLARDKLVTEQVSSQQESKEEEVALPSAEVVLLGLPGVVQEQKDVVVQAFMSKKAAKRSTFEKRLAFIEKKVRGATSIFGQHRNKLKDLTCAIANDSASQAAFLNGMNKKFAAKAVRRAGTLDTTVDQLWAQLQKQLPHWDSALATTMPPLDAFLLNSSCLSCNTTREALEEWPKVMRAWNQDVS